MVEWFEWVFQKARYIIPGLVTGIIFASVLWYCRAWRRWLAALLTVLTALLIVWDFSQYQQHGRIVLPLLYSTPFVFLAIEVLVVLEAGARRWHDQPSEGEGAVKNAHREVLSDSIHRLSWLTFGLLASAVPIVAIVGLMLFELRPSRTEELKLYAGAFASLCLCQYPIVILFGKPGWLGGVAFTVVSYVAFTVIFGFYNLMRLNSV
ncbi:MAG: hypothetical protein MUF23_03230 [Pirellula sp.]|nr:hypothetical protein [Pirellula sp.]